MPEEEANNLSLIADKAPGEEYLTFSLAAEDYGVAIQRVQEIRGWEAVTRIPNAPDYVKGVLNMRGSIVPVIDMRQRLRMPLLEYSKETVVIVVKVIDAMRERVMGLVVDAVSDVVTARSDALREAPELGTDIAAEFLAGAIDVDGKMLMLLDVDRLMCRDVGCDPGGKSAA
jgi:purine-binding chemotaxis protein CheW